MVKNILVTGGSRGIGKAVCLKFGKIGYHVLINFRSNVAEANNTLTEIRENGGSGELMQFDVSVKEEVTSILGNWIENHPDEPIEILVNNAGIRDDGLMIWMNDDQWKNVIGSSLGGFFHVTKLVLNGMLIRRYGRIINVVSLSGIKGMPGQTNYSAAKAGVIGATKALAQEVARRGVTVNAVAPGFIRTDMTKDLNELELRKLIPMQRFGEAHEVADAIVFLASQGASYITGAVLSINGGIYT